MLAYDPDDTTTRTLEWWNEIGESSPKPYEIEAWTITTYIVQEIDET